jgi:gliding motility-associated-like protein
MTLYDANNPGCNVTKNFALPQKDGPIPYVRINDIRCFGGADGEIVVDSISRGVPNFDITVFALSSSFTTTQTGIGQNTTATFNGLALDNYGMTITDQECSYNINTYYLFNGLTYDTIVAGNFPIDQASAFDATIYTSNTDRHLNAGSALITKLTGGTPAFAYSFGGGPYAPVVNDSIKISGLDIGSFTVNIMDAGGCSYVISFNIEVGLYIPNLITPNGDKHNDVWEIVALPMGTEVRIFNKWGGRVYFTKDYDNSWDGNNEPAGVYFYELILPDNKLYKGWIEIVK